MAWPEEEPELHFINIQCTLGYEIYNGTEAVGLHEPEWPD